MEDVDSMEYRQQRRLIYISELINLVKHQDEPYPSFAHIKGLVHMQTWFSIPVLLSSCRWA